MCQPVANRNCVAITLYPLLLQGISLHGHARDVEYHWLQDIFPKFTYAPVPLLPQQCDTFLPQPTSL